MCEHLFVSALNLEQLAGVDWRVLTEQINETLGPYQHDLIAVYLLSGIWYIW